MSYYDQLSEVLKAQSVNRAGVTKANALIASGAVNTSASWSFSAEDGNKLLGSNKDWGKYASFHLGVNTSAADKTKARWSFPFGKGGKVYRSALVAIRQRAGQQKDTAIFNAAGTLLKKLDKKTGKKAKSELHENLRRVLITT